jgi:hypothetical protein
VKILPVGVCLIQTMPTSPMPRCQKSSIGQLRPSPITQVGSAGTLRSGHGLDRDAPRWLLDPGEGGRPARLHVYETARAVNPPVVYAFTLLWRHFRTPEIHVHNGMLPIGVRSRAVHGGVLYKNGACEK